MAGEEEAEEKCPEAIPLSTREPNQSAPVPLPTSPPRSAFRRICRSRVLWVSILVLIVFIAGLFIGGAFLLTKQEEKLIALIPNVDGKLFHLPPDRKKLVPLVMKTHEDLRSYRDLSHSDDIVNCTGTEPPAGGSKSCEFNLAQETSPTCTYAEGFGYFIGQPCLFLQPGRVPDWQPEPFPADGPFPEGMPTRILREYTEDMIYVDCQGELPMDAELIGPIEYSPLGFSTKYFPFKGHPSYQPPLVSLQFRGIAQGIVVSVKCRMMAKNIKEDDDLAAVSFAILVD